MAALLLSMQGVTLIFNKLVTFVITQKLFFEVPMGHLRKAV